MRAPPWLIQILLGRGILAIAWAVAFSRAHDRLDIWAVTLLVLYPLLDAISSAFDYLMSPSKSDRRVTGFNAILSMLAAAAIGAAGSYGSAAATLAVFGVWAFLSGAAQVGLALRRRGPELGKQWPLLIAGSLSCAVGVLYVVQAAGSAPSLDVLAVYATGGGFFFIVQAALLAWRMRGSGHAL